MTGKLDRPRNPAPANLRLLSVCIERWSAYECHGRIGKSVLNIRPLQQHFEFSDQLRVLSFLVISTYIQSALEG
jgi:hypothetical protein